MSSPENMDHAGSTPAAPSGRRGGSWMRWLIVVLLLLVIGAWLTVNVFLRSDAGYAPPANAPGAAN